MTTDPKTDRLIRAPWTPEQVAALNAFQERGGMHPFTCGREAHGVRLVLLAHRDGWHCSDPACDYRQDWAHAFMAERGRAVAAAAEVSPPPDQTLRDRIAEALETAWQDHYEEGYGLPRDEMAAAVLAVLPPPADRATVLLKAAQHLYTALFPAVYDDMGQKAAEGVNRAVSELRRLAAEAQQQGDAGRRVYAWAQTIDTADGGNTVCIPGVHHSGGGSEETAVIVSREDVPVLAAMLAEAQQPDTGRSDVGTEFVRQTDHPDGAALEAWEADLIQSGVDTPGCDCGHDGMGRKWHSEACRWRAALIAEAHRLLAMGDLSERPVPVQPAAAETDEDPWHDDPKANTQEADLDRVDKEA